MNPPRFIAASFAFLLLVGFVRADDSAPLALSANDLAARLSALQEDGSSYVRLRMQVQQPPGTVKFTLQIQIKERITKTAADIIYQILWPKELKGEAMLLHRSVGQPPSGSLYMPPGKVRSLDFSQMNESLFDSDLSAADVIENFFAWKKQAISGTEAVNRVSCQIL